MSWSPPNHDAPTTVTADPASRPGRKEGRPGGGKYTWLYVLVPLYINRFFDWQFFRDAVLFVFSRYFFAKKWRDHYRRLTVKPRLYYTINYLDCPAAGGEYATNPEACVLDPQGYQPPGIDPPPSSTTRAMISIFSPQANPTHEIIFTTTCSQNSRN